MNARRFIFLLVLLLFFSCDKDNVNKEFGQYAIAIKYKGSAFIDLQVIVDEKPCGTLTPAPNVNPSYIAECSDLKNPEELVNVFVLRDIPVGDHQVKIATEEGTVLKSLTFQMLDKECVFQEVEITPLTKKAAF